MVPASGVAVFGPLQFQAGRACYACALGRSYFGRAAAPRALGPSIMPPAWTVPPSMGLLCPPGPVLDLPGAAGAGARQPGPGRGRVPWASCAHRGQLPPRLPWAVDHAARPAWAAAPGADQPTGPRDFAPAILPLGAAGIFPRNTRVADFPRS